MIHLSQVAGELYAEQEAPADTDSSSSAGIRVQYSLRRPALPDAFAAMGPEGDAAQQATERHARLGLPTSTAPSAASEPADAATDVAAAAEAASAPEDPNAVQMAVEGVDADSAGAALAEEGPNTEKPGDTATVVSAAAVVPRRSSSRLATAERGSALDAPLDRDLILIDLDEVGELSDASGGVAERLAGGDAAGPSGGVASGA